MAISSMSRSCLCLRSPLAAPSARPLVLPARARRSIGCQSSKGFGDDAKPASPAKRGSKANKKGKIEPQVKVTSAVVDAVTGKSPATTDGQAETAAVLFLFYFFLLIMVQGLLLAGSGFLPEDWDLWVQDKVYPNFSSTVLLFLGCSSLYGLYKTGKLPGQKQL